MIWTIDRRHARQDSGVPRGPLCYSNKMEERLARCLLISKILAADGIMTDDERSFLESAMQSLELTEAERAQCRRFEGWEEAQDTIAALSVEDKRVFMDGLVQAVLADGKVSPHEMSTIEKLSAALGLS